MTESERIDYLVNRLEGGKAIRFSERTGICPQSVSRLRNGKSGIGIYIGRILSAYPDVNEIWLRTGNGEPLPASKRRSVIWERIEALEAEVRRLAEMVEKMANTHK